MKTYHFPGCGCHIPIDDGSPDVFGNPALIYPHDPEELNEDCPVTWQLLGDGCTKGIFQLESPLGRQYTRKLRPESKLHLSALGALLRPGCLKAKDDKGVSMTDLFCLRKNGIEPTTYFHPSLEPLLGDTYGVLTYQEQAMAIAVALAGFTPQQADDLRKAIGKKKTDVMAKVKGQFVTGAANTGIVNEEDAAAIFANIEKSQRYSFNKSHALCYGLIGFHTAHLKAHFPLQFYTSWLWHAKEKMEPLVEIRQLVNDAKGLGIEVLPPRFEELKYQFTTDGVVVTFGLSDVKGIGKTRIQKLRSNMEVVEKEVGVPRMEWGWLDFLINFSPACNSTVAKRMIEVGAMAKYKVDRQRMLAEYNAFNELTEKEQRFISRSRSLGCTEESDEYMFKREYDQDVNEVKIESLADGIQILLDTPKGIRDNRRRDKVASILKRLHNPPRPLVDTPEWIAKTEQECLGIPISCSKIDGHTDLKADTTCKEFREGKDSGVMVIAVDIQDCREIRIQNGQNRGKTMAFLTVTDSTGSLEDVCIFSDAWDRFQNMIFVGSSIEMGGRRDPKRGSFIVEEVCVL